MLFYIINLFIVGFAFAGPNNLEKDAQNKVLQSQKVMWSCHILRQKNADKIIKELELTSKTIPVFLVPKGDNFRPVVKFKIKFPREIGQVFVGKSTPLMASDLKDEQFFYAYLNSRINTVELTAKYKSGEQVKEILYLFAPEAREYQMLE
ncbi:MAG: hypothetical protein KDD50_08590, partial [Bdellovibrionales bacterium]|nr:hypothetical protein [Bdellovibrionales bacterium]